MFSNFEFWTIFLGPKTLIGKHASKAIVEHIRAKPESPLFAYVAFGAVHEPRQAPKMFLDLTEKNGGISPEDHVRKGNIHEKDAR